jgi:hypothetical protein
VEKASAVTERRLLLFERDPGKRYYFEKYVLGILWRGLSEEEKEQRVVDALRRRRAHSDESISKSGCRSQQPAENSGTTE